MQVEFPDKSLPPPWIDYNDSVASRIGPEHIEIVARCYARTHDDQLNEIPESEVNLQARHHQAMILAAPEMFAELNKVLAGDISLARISALLHKAAAPHASVFWAGLR